MSHPTDIKPQAIQFYSTASYACSYLEHKQARSMVAAPSHLIDAHTYSQLVDQGFRRSGTFTYKPYCDACQACIPIRVDAANFSPDRSQRRVLKRLSAMQGQVFPLQWHDEHYELYHRYQQQRHPKSGIDDDTAAQYSQFLLSSHVDSRLIEFRDENQLLQIVAIIDLLDNGISAVYTFFNPDSKASLGTYAILWQIQMCHNLDLPWLYLGYWIEESRKMAYKTRFTPYQLLQHGKWSDSSL